MTRFSAKIDQWAKMSKASVSRVVRGSTMEIGSRAIDASPVDTGRFKGNWQLNERGFDENRLDPSGAQTKAKIQAAIAQSEVGAVNSLINNLPYAERLEYGHSKQAPSPPGIVRAVALIWRDIVNAFAAAERK